MDKLIKVAELKKIIAGDISSVSVLAKLAVSGNGYYLVVETTADKYVLATYLSKPKLFKRADALVKEVAELGISALSFDISNWQEIHKKELFK